MKFPVQLKRLIDDGWQARCRSPLFDTVCVEADTREAALDKARQEIRYRLELCPCSGVTDDFVELDVTELSCSRWRGSVF